MQTQFYSFTHTFYTPLSTCFYLFIILNPISHTEDTCQRKEFYERFHPVWIKFRKKTNKFSFFNSMSFGSLACLQIFGYEFMIRYNRQYMQETHYRQLRKATRLYEEQNKNYDFSRRSILTLIKFQVTHFVISTMLVNMMVL